MIPNMAAAMMHGLNGGAIVTAVSLDNGDFYGYIAPGGPTASSWGESGGAIAGEIIPGHVIDGIFWQHKNFNNQLLLSIVGDQTSMSWAGIKIGDVIVPFDNASYYSGDGYTVFTFFEGDPSTPLPMTAGIYTARLV